MKQWFTAQRQQQIAWYLLALVMLIYTLEMSHQAVLRYDTFKATAFDLGNMDQVLWNTIRGRLFQFTNQAADWYGPPTRLAIHFEPIILPLSLLYIFQADPRILLVFQTFALVSGALPVFLLTRKYLSEWPILAALMAVAYLFSPALLGLNIFDFHPISLATPLLLYALLALTYKRYGWFLLACILAASCKEDIPLTLAVLGVFLIWKYKLPRLGITLTLGGLIWSLLAFRVIIPHFYPGIQSNNFWYRYEALGSSPSEAITNLLLHPWLLFTTFMTMDRFYYLASLFRSSGFLSLLAPEWMLIALPNLAENLLSTDPLIYSGVYHYNAAIIPFVMISAIHGARRLINLWHTWRGEAKIQGTPYPDDGAEMQQGTVSPNGCTEVQRTPSSDVDMGVQGTQSPDDGAGVQGTPSSDRDAEAQRTPSPKGGAGVQGTPSPDGGTGVSPDPPPFWWGGVVGKPLAGVRKHLINLLAAARRTTLYSRLSAIFKKRQQGFKHTLSQHWQRFSERMIPIASAVSVLRLQWIIFAWITAMLLLNFVILAPLLNNFWADHQPGSREQHIQHLLAIIPLDASVSASSNLNPHVSERQRLAVFPSISAPGHGTAEIVQYIIVDLNTIFPEDRVATVNEINQLVHSGQYSELARADGVVLLIRRGT